MIIKPSSIKATKLRQQLKLLEKSESSGVPLSEILKEVGWTYDDLSYEHSNAQNYKSIDNSLLGNFGAHTSAPSVVSFFSGCGGMDLGFEALGYKHVAAFEFNELFCKTLRRNRPLWNIFGPPNHSGDVSKFDDIAQVLSPLIKDSFNGVFIGGPPCQPFSIASNQRFSKSGESFKRIGFSHEKNGNLLFDYIRLIIEFQPKAFVIENVPGLRDIDNGVQLGMAIEQLQANGYHVAQPFVLNAAHYGVPQQRFRLFVIGWRGQGEYKNPAPQLQLIGAGSVLCNLLKLPNTETRDHKAESILRYMRLKYGQRDQLGRVDRLNPLLPSKTVIAGGTKGGGRSHLHPEIPRTLSVRECAQLQTFPNDYVFVGPSARQFTQVGNAVPPVLAAHIAKSLIQSFF